MPSFYAIMAVDATRLEKTGTTHFGAIAYGRHDGLIVLPSRTKRR